MKVGILQLKVGPLPEENIKRAATMVKALALQGAEMVLLPEMFCCPYENSAFQKYAQPAKGVYWQALSHCAAENHVYLVAGSVPEQAGDNLYNTSYVFGPDGKELARHRKMHLFDIAVAGGQHFKESDTFSAGNKVTTFKTPFGIMGLCICFDMRFPELARLMALQGAIVMFVPAAFNSTTGPAHWEILMRQRAVDNQCFVCACAPATDKSASYVSYAHSMVVSPWGKVLYDAGQEERAEVVEIELSKAIEVRKQLPLLSARREDIYMLKQL